MGIDPDRRWKVTAWSATALAREASGRDIAVRIVSSNSGCGAMDFDPNSCTIRLVAGDVGLSDATPTVLVDSLISRLRSPVLAGVVLAGAARAAHSRWVEIVPDDTPTELLSAAWQLDRSRAKARLIARRPQDRLFLRAAAGQLLSVEFDPQDGRDVTRTVVTELLPDIDSGVLPRWMGPNLRQLAEDDLGVQFLNRLTDLWREVQLVADNDAATLLDLARRWLDMWDHRPDPAPSGSARADSLMTAANLLLTQVADDAIADALGESTALLGSRKSPAQESDDQEQDLSKTHSAAAFGPNNRIAVKHRTPTVDDHRRRLTTVRRLRRAQYRASHRVGIPVGYPTGRARGDALMQRAAQRAQGVAVTATPWKQRRWRSVPKPPIHAGIVVDLSGSMSPWLPAAGTAIWSMAAAVAELGGSAAAAGFAGAVFPLLRPRTAPVRVPVLSQKGGSDGCADAMAAVTGAADLARPGAAVMIVLTDGHLPPTDQGPIDSHAQYLRRHEVHLIWALIGTRTTQTVIPRDALVIEQVTPDSFPTLVADAIAATLTDQPV